MPYRLSAPAKTYWASHDTWCCPLHGRHERLPAQLGQCWFDKCTSKRPVGGRPDPVAPPVVVRAPIRPPVVATRVVEAVATPETAVAALPDDASAGSKRRGSHKVTCAHCGATLWRKPSEIKNSTVFFCNRVHQNDYRMDQERKRLGQTE